MKHWLLLAAAAALAGAGGCTWVGESARLQAELDAAHQREGELQATIAAQEKLIAGLRGLGDKRLEKLFHVEQIELGRYTGGVDTDDQPGDDAIKVYLRPMDRDGSTIKAAGDVTIQLYDLAEPPESNLIGEYKWSVDELSRQWSSGFMTYHFSFVCPWRADPPKHEEITVRVTFTDYLTGRTFSEQKACTITLPPGK